MPAESQSKFPQARYIDPTARVYGKVEIGENASLWPYCVIRAEGLYVRIGRYCNLQDHAMVHVGYKLPTVVGEYCSITHRAVLHGCTIGDNCLVAIGATVMEGAVIGENSIVAGHAFVPEGMVVPPNSVVMGAPARVVRTRNNFLHTRANAMLYYRNAQCYAQGNHRGWEGPEFEAQMQAWRAEIEAEYRARYGSG